ncbi:MAG: protein kinase domain-containing protein [Anaeromyxobacteraceae bacterium]
MPPRTVGPYEVLSVIGRGGVGTVYRARHRLTGDAVAVKLLAPPPACDATAARRLAREFEALEGLEHPNVVRVFEAGVHEGYSFIAMELVEGLDLRSYLSPALDDAASEAPPARPSAFDAPCDEPVTDPSPSFAPDVTPPPRAGAEALRAFAALMDEPETDVGWDATPAARHPRPSDSPGAAPETVGAVLERLNGAGRVARLHDAVRQLCAGLGYIHERGLVHRDLKPSNIMVDDARRVRLMDFGLVKLATDAAQLTHHGQVVGTYRYMSPEQACGTPVDARSDLYSVGVILFELLCGTPPFVARRPADLWEEIMRRPAPAVASVNPGADARLAAVAERLLAKRPADRFQCAEDVIAALG